MIARHPAGHAQAIVIHKMAPPLRDAASIVDVLRWRAEHQARRVALSFIGDRHEEPEPLTYAELDHRARAIAARLSEHAVAGDRALLLHPPGLDFVVALFGCFYAGVIAVPLYPPKPNRRDNRFVEITRDAGARVALTTPPVLATVDRAFEHSPELADLEWIASGSEGSSTRTIVAPRPTADSVAYLQYTSGSTRTPKGVIVSHGNVRANIDDIDRAFHHDEHSVSISWLPHFHDMGLVYGLLAPIALGFRCYFMAPATFLQRPVSWLDAISRYRATHTGGPNFAYELCVRRVTPEQKVGLDLSCWSVAFNGAEPVRQETLDGFARTFADVGFAPGARCPSYGLAEATLKVTTGRRGDGPTYFRASSEALRLGSIAPAATDSDERVLVGCGPPDSVTEVVIVNPETLVPSAPDTVGEIWVHGPSVAHGYWSRPEESALVFRASLGGGASSAHYLRTGDLGFIRNGELFVTGRLKDLIIVRGRNHYPQDIELTAQNSHPALRIDGGAAFSVEAAGEERLVIVQEIDRHRHADAEEAAVAIRQAIVEVHEIAPYAVLLVRQQTVPKTSSGKVQRRACAEAFLNATLSAVFEWKDSLEAATETTDIEPRSREDIESFLLQFIAKSLSVSPNDVDPEQPFSAFGLDSLQTLTFVGELETWLQRSLSPTLFWNYPTVSSLAAHLSAESGAVDAAAP